MTNKIGIGRVSKTKTGWVGIAEDRVYWEPAGDSIFDAPQVKFFRTRADAKACFECVAKAEIRLLAKRK